MLSLAIWLDPSNVLRLIFAGHAMAWGQSTLTELVGLQQHNSSTDANSAILSFQGHMPANLGMLKDQNREQLRL